MVSDKINFRKGSGYNDINFRQREHLYRGQTVCMGMENGEWSHKAAFVAGDVDFQ